MTNALCHCEVRSYGRAATRSDAVISVRNQEPFRVSRYACLPERICPAAVRSTQATADRSPHRRAVRSTPGSPDPSTGPSTLVSTRASPDRSTGPSTSGSSVPSTDCTIARSTEASTSASPYQSTSGSADGSAEGSALETRIFGVEFIAAKSLMTKNSQVEIIALDIMNMARRRTHVTLRSCAGPRETGAQTGQ